MGRCALEHGRDGAANDNLARIEPRRSRNYVPADKAHYRRRRDSFQNQVAFLLLAGKQASM